MSDFSPDDPLVGVFDRYAFEVSPDILPASAAVYAGARHHRRVRSTGIAIAVAAAVAATPVAVMALDGHRLGSSTPAEGLPVVVSGAVPTGTGVLQCPGGAVPVQVPPSPFLGSPDYGSVPQTGPLFYLQAGAVGQELQLVSWTPGTATIRAVWALPVDAWMNVNVSPNGKWVSWVSVGQLHVATLTGPPKIDRVLSDSVDGELLEPVWSADSTRLLISDLSAKRIGTIDVNTGAFTPLPQSLSGARHAVWAADGSGFAFLAADGSIMVARPDGTDQRQIPAAARFYKEGWKVSGLQSLSGIGDDDTLSASLVQSGTPIGGCRSLLSNTLIRVGAGTQMMEQSQAGAAYSLFQASFRGHAFEHISRSLDSPRTIELVGTNGEHWGGVPEPKALADYALLN